eukprot:4507735-Pleurochrysis_carterae.AAC.1
MRARAQSSTHIAEHVGKVGTRFLKRKPDALLICRPSSNKGQKPELVMTSSSRSPRWKHASARQSAPSKFLIYT